MKRKSIRKINEKKYRIFLFGKTWSIPVQISSFIFGIIAAGFIFGIIVAIKTSLSLYWEKRKIKDTEIVELISKDTLAEQSSRKSKAILTFDKAVIKKSLYKIKEMFILAKDEIKQKLIQAKAKRACNKASKERKSVEKLAASGAKEKKELRDVKAKPTSSKTKTKKSAGKTKEKKGSTHKKKKKIPLYRRVLSLIIKITIFAFGLVIVFGYIFGLSRNQSLNMQPAFQDGDLILYLRTYKSYTANDTIVLSYEDKTMLERVVAIGGDTVDITERGLEINGGLVQESYAWGETTQFENGITFPLTVPEGKIFVLGDNREHAMDSRILGCINESDVNGSVIGSFRRRNF